MTQEYLQMILALSGILILIGMLAYLARKKQLKSGLIDVVAYHSLGPRKGIAALRVGAEILIVGVTMTDIKLLTSFKASDLDATGVQSLQDRIAGLKSLKETIRESQ